MKKIIGFCLIGLSLSIGTSAFANQKLWDEQSIVEKIYVEPGSVYVGPNGIFLNINGIFFPIKAVCMDEQGIYALGLDAKRMVYCPICRGYYNADSQSSECRNGYHPWICQYQP